MVTPASPVVAAATGSLVGLSIVYRELRERETSGVGVPLAGVT